MWFQVVQGVLCSTGDVIHNGSSFRWYGGVIKIRIGCTWYGGVSSRMVSGYMRVVLFLVL